MCAVWYGGKKFKDKTSKDIMSKEKISHGEKRLRDKTCNGQTV